MLVKTPTTLENEECNQKPYNHEFLVALVRLPRECNLNPITMIFWWRSSGCPLGTLPFHFWPPEFKKWNGRALGILYLSSWTCRVWHGLMIWVCQVLVVNFTNIDPHMELLLVLPTQEGPLFFYMGFVESIKPVSFFMEIGVSLNETGGHMRIPCIQ